MTQLRLVVGAAGCVVLVVSGAACGSATSSALYSLGRPWAATKTGAPVGQVWSTGGIPLCTKGRSPVTITSVGPVAVRGQIRVSRIVVRRRGGADTAVGTYPGVPSGGERAAGLVIPSPSPCNGTAVHEAFVAASRTGAGGGYVKNLRFAYRVGSARRVFVLPFTYALCGRQGPAPALTGCPAVVSEATGAKVALNYNCVFPSASLMPQARATHAQWIRIVISWAALEPAPGAYRRGYLGRIVKCLEAAHRDGLQVLAVLIATPGWANDNAGQLAPPTHDTSYAQAIGYLARAYPAAAPSGIDAFEVWNEVNTKHFWTGTIAQYEKLLAAAYPAVKRYSTAEVVLAGTAHIDEPWDRAILAAGYGRYFDVLGVHPYPRDPTNTDVAQVFNAPADAPNTLDRLKTDLVHYGYPQKPIWLTEIGWSTADISDSAQATVLRNTYDYLRNSGCYACSSIQLAFWYALLDTTGGYDGGLSLLHPDLSPKPAYSVLAAPR
jgi:hypothetical protein